MEENFLTRQEAAERLGVHVTTVDRMVLAGKLKKFERGADPLTYFKEDHIEELLKFRQAA